MSGARRGFFRDALAGLKKVLDETTADLDEAAPPTPTFVPPPHPESPKATPAAAVASVSPSAAVAVATAPRAGKAKVAARLCLNHGGTFEDEAPCENCVDWCPEKGAIALGDDLIPRIVPALCTGCGACADHCKAYPAAITIV